MCAYDEEAGGGAGLEPVVRPLLPGLEVFAEWLAVRHDLVRPFRVLAQRIDRKVCGEQRWDQDLFGETGFGDTM